MPTLVLLAGGLVLALWCVADLLPRSDAELRVLGRTGWVAVVVLVPVLGGLAYLALGRPAPGQPGARPGARPAPRPPVRGPEDDPEFQARLRRRVEEQRRRAREQGEGE